MQLRCLHLPVLRCWWPEDAQRRDARHKPCKTKPCTFWSMCSHSNAHAWRNSLPVVVPAGAVGSRSPIMTCRSRTSTWRRKAGIAEAVRQGEDALDARDARRLAAAIWHLGGRVAVDAVRQRRCRTLYSIVRALHLYRLELDSKLDAVAWLHVMELPTHLQPAHERVQDSLPLTDIGLQPLQACMCITSC
jgi:hypothetical protein